MIESARPHTRRLERMKERTQKKTRVKKKIQDTTRLRGARPHCRRYITSTSNWRRRKPNKRMAVGNATTTQCAVQIMMIVSAAVPVLTCMWSNAIDTDTFVNTLWIVFNFFFFSFAFDSLFIPAFHLFRAHSQQHPISYLFVNSVP